MKSIFLAVLGLTLISCRGKDGKDGEPGRSFSSSMVNKNGAVTSDEIAVKVDGLNLNRGDLLGVYTCITTACVQVNVFQAGTGNNIFYIANGDTVTIYQAKAGGQTLWYISAILKI